VTTGVINGAAIAEEDPIAVARDAVEEMNKLREELTAALQRADYMAERVSEADKRADNWYRELEEFKQRVSDVGEAAAEKHDWCSVYDDIMEELGLPGRLREFEVDVEVTYTTTVTVEARSMDDAESVVNDADIESYWSPGVPFDLQTSGYAGNVSVSVC